MNTIEYAIPVVFQFIFSFPVRSKSHLERALLE